MKGRGTKELEQLRHTSLKIQEATSKKWCDRWEKSKTIRQTNQICQIQKNDK